MTEQFEVWWVTQNIDHPVPVMVQALKELAWKAWVASQSEDTKRMDWLDMNLFYREPDEFDRKHGVCKTGEIINWQIYAPRGIQGSARNIIDGAMNG